MKLTWGKLAVAAAAVSLVAGACGSSNGSAKSASAPSGSGAAPNSKQMTNLTVAYAATGAGFSDLYVGVTDGIFKQHGLNVTLVKVTPANLISSILSGSVQIGGGVADGPAAAIIKGEPMKYVALTEGTYNLQLWVNKDITSLQDLSGKSLALTTQGSETDFGLTNLLQKNGMSATSVDRKYLVSTSQMISAIRSGAVAGGFFQPPTAQSLTQIGGHVLTSLSDLPYAVGSYVTSQSYASSHTDVLKEFYQAETANLAYLRSHETQAEAAIQKYNPQTSSADAQIAYKFFLNVWKQDPSVTPSLISDAFQRAAAKDKTSPPSDVSKYIYSAS